MQKNSQIVEGRRKHKGLEKGSNAGHGPSLLARANYCKQGWEWTKSLLL